MILVAKGDEMWYYLPVRRRVAQLAEQRPPNPQVAGSIPVPPATRIEIWRGAGVAERGRLENVRPFNKVRGFESHPLRQGATAPTVRGGRIEA